MKILVTESQLRVIKEMAVSAYHGTPHKFDKFTTSKVGSGESTQWFGWGLYFTDDESIAQWYSKSVMDSKNAEHKKKNLKIYFRDKLIFDREPNNVSELLGWPVIKSLEELSDIPWSILGRVLWDIIDNFYVYKESELEGYKSSRQWFDQENFESHYNKKFEGLKQEVGYSPRAFRDEKGSLIVLEYPEDDPHIVKLTKEWNDKYGKSLTTREYMIQSWMFEKIYRHWMGPKGYDVYVDFNYLTDEKKQEYKVRIFNLLKTIQPDDMVLKYNDDLFTKSNIYNVTLHKDKTPDEYDYLDWYGELTPKQKGKILSKLKEDGYKSEKFVMVVPTDDDNLEGVKPKFFDTVTRAKDYILRQSYKVALTGKGYMGSLKVVKSGFNMKTDINAEVSEFYSKLCGLMGSDKKASMFLLSAGIDGIKYPTNTISGGESKGFNYVVFDENSVHIDKVDEK